MQFAGMNWLAIIVAALIGFGIGAVFYSLLGARWMKAARIQPEGKAGVSPLLLANSLVMELLMATVTAGVIGHLGPGQVTVFNGLVSGLFLWGGFVATTLSVNHRYQGFGWDLTLIDGLHWLLVLLAMGATIGAFGV